MKNLRQIRTKLGFSQKQVADAVHISRAHYCNIENCKREPSFAMALEIASFLNVTVDELRDNAANDGDELQARMDILFRELNNAGKHMVIDYAAMLVEKPAFREEESVSSAM